VPEEAVTEPLALASPREETGDVRHHEPSAISLLVHDPELGREGGKRIVVHPRTSCAERAEQRRLTRVGHTDETHVREDPELQTDLALLTGQTSLPERRGLAGGGSERAVATPAFSAAGDDEARPRLGEVGEETVLVEDLGPDGDLEQRVLAALAGPVIGRTVAAAARFHHVAVGVGFQGREVFRADEDHISAVAATAAVGSAAWLVFLAVERDAAVAPAAGADDEVGFIYELQRG
jgi:hypothetical protein